MRGKHWMAMVPTNDAFIIRRKSLHNIWHTFRIKFYFYSSVILFQLSRRQRASDSQRLCLRVKATTEETDDFILAQVRMKINHQLYCCRGGNLERLLTRTTILFTWNHLQIALSLAFVIENIHLGCVPRRPLLARNHGVHAYARRFEGHIVGIFLLPLFRRRWSGSLCHFLFSWHLYWLFWYFFRRQLLLQIVQLDVAKSHPVPAIIILSLGIHQAHNC
mmetsp:Transcript_5436/g.19814  ORF Transcript_5436/g.19814 Transcript_5436/m.19814 type:complete len:219 (+) Transcript_5436:560-1216(+)